MLFLDVGAVALLEPVSRSDLVEDFRILEEFGSLFFAVN
jgi:hypothetical protein